MKLFYSFTFALFYLLSSPAFGAVSFDAVTTVGNSTGSNTIATTHTVGGGCANPLLIATVSWKSGSPETISSVVATAGAMTVVATQVDSGSGVHSVAMYRLTGAKGAQTVTSTFSAGVDVATMALRSYCGADQATPVGTGAVNTGGFDSTPPSVGVTSIAGDLVIDVVKLFGDAAATLTVDASQTQRDNFFENRAIDVQADSDEVASTTTTTMSWSKSPANSWAMVGVALKAAAAPGVAGKHRAIVVQ